MTKTKVEKHFDKVASKYDYYKTKNSFYYENLKKLLGSLIPQGKKVFEIGCGTGDLLVTLAPGRGYGMDISSKMIGIAKNKYKSLENINFSTKWPGESFEYIYMSDVIEHLENPISILSKVSKLMNKDTVFVITMANPVWEPLLMIAEKLGLKMPEGPHNRIKSQELEIMMEKAGLKIIKHDYKLLIPVKISVITKFANKYLERPLRKLAFIENFVVVKA